MKFGGTSVGSVNSILSVKRIVEAVDEPVIVVVSALGGITDKLIKTPPEWRQPVMLLTRMSSGRLSIVMWK